MRQLGAQQLAVHGDAVASGRHLGHEAQQLGHRHTGRIPGEVGGRAVHQLLLGEGGQARFALYRGEGVAGYQHLAFFPKEGDVARRMAGGVQPAPAGQAGHAAIFGQRLHAGAHIIRALGIYKRHISQKTTAHGGVGRRVARAARE
nr:hypothetical protein [Tanacetum cinerariifolium]